jgi:septum formation protein
MPAYGWNAQVYHLAVRLVLASASPRRAELLRAAGFVFTVDPAHADESVHPGEAAAAYARRVAAEKAAVVSARHPGHLVLGADTIVVVDGDILGKPADPDEARRMLARLSGRTHEVMTAVCARRDGEVREHLESSRVRFAPLSAAEIAWYAASGEPADKAGAYAVQGLASRFVEAVDGSCANVVGLPVAAVWRLVRDLGFSDLPGGPAFD